jgi:hypothetical protein
MARESGYDRDEASQVVGAERERARRVVGLRPEHEQSGSRKKGGGKGKY